MEVALTDANTFANNFRGIPGPSTACSTNAFSFGGLIYIPKGLQCKKQIGGKRSSFYNKCVEIDKAPIGQRIPLAGDTNLDYMVALIEAFVFSVRLPQSIRGI